MNHTEEIDDNINELIMQKSFDKLTSEEKQKALAYAGGEEEYNTLRSTLLAITNSFGSEEEEIADLGTKNNLIQQFEKKFGTDNGRTKIVPLYRKPYFQLAAAASVALIIFFSFPFLSNNAKQESNQLALNAEKTGKESTVAVPGSTEPASVAMTLEDKSNLKQEEKAINRNTTSKDVQPDEMASNDETILNSTATLAEEKSKEQPLKESEAKIDTKNTTVNTVEKNPYTYKVMAEELANERRKMEAEKGKKKDADKRADLAAAKSESQKDNGTDAIATGGVFNPSGPSANLANAFMNEKKTEMMDLLFTAF